MFIAYLGLKNGGIIQSTSSGLFISENICSVSVLIFFAGLFITCALKILGFRGHIIWGIFAGALLAGNGRKINRTAYLISAMLIVYMVFVRSR